MAPPFNQRLRRVFCIAGMTMWLAMGWPILRSLANDEMVRGAAVPPLWPVFFALFGLAILIAMAVRLRGAALWSALSAELACVVAMTLLVPWAGMTQFLTIIAWQAATATSAGRAIGWVAFQTIAVVAALAQALNPDLCWIIGKSVALQMLLVFTACALRREAVTALALEHSNDELRAAQAVIASAARDAERLRISRELHDAWGHELTALSLQLEIASHMAEPARTLDHVAQAKGLSRTLLTKVRDVVATLREAERCDLAETLRGFARTVPVPAIHVDVAPGISVGPDQAHALIRCAQEAVTNAVRHADATNLWLTVAAEDGGIRLVARDDGRAATMVTTVGTGLRGMRERVEHLGGELAIRVAGGRGFTIEAWLPSGASRAI